jgi:hypothetical protein
MWWLDEPRARSETPLRAEERQIRAPQLLCRVMGVTLKTWPTYYARSSSDETKNLPH